MTATEPRKAASGALYAMVDGRPRKIKATVESINEDFARLNAEIRRLRISQLRRMASACGGIEERMLTKASRQGLSLAYYRRCVWVRERGNRFRRACRAEIERLRGEG